ncbi:MAG: hypothetical protein RLZZ630_2198 [Bacteroidota bacterium]|jgi:membrane-bound lytic murein transglycosylase D
MKGLKYILLSLVLVGSNFSTRAQEVATVPPVDRPYDPIVAMMDSLVTLTHVIRYNQLDANCFEADATNCPKGPSFSDEVYTRRIDALHSPIPLSYNRHVREFIELYANRKRGLTQRVMGLSNLYFPLFEEVLDREGLPLEFKYLSIVESALNPIAVSRVGATGIWQFMYNTGKLYDLNVTSYIDDRRDPVKATVAACQYFKDMYRIYGDWLLVIASYNCGPGNVNRAIKRSGGKTNFWEIMPYLPAETRNYVPAFIAVTYVMNHAREHQLYPVAPAYSYFEVDTVTVDRPVSFQVLSQSLGLPQDVIAYLNPVYKKGMIPDVGSGYTLRLPTNKMAQFIDQQESILAQSKMPARPVMPVYASSRNTDEEVVTTVGTGKFETVTKKIKKTHTVRKGESLGKIAARYDMGVDELKKMNRLRSSSIRPGQRLSVITWQTVKVEIREPVAATTPKSDSLDQTTQAQKVQDTAQQADTVSKNQQENVEGNGMESSGSRFVYHIVQPGDTLWNIARRYEGTTVELIKDINKLQDANLKPGTRLKVIVNG